jgi:hypothetical protein
MDRSQRLKYTCTSLRQVEPVFDQLSYVIQASAEGWAGKKSPVWGAETAIKRHPSLCDGAADSNLDAFNFIRRRSSLCRLLNISRFGIALHRYNPFMFEQWRPLGQLTPKVGYAGSDLCI